MTVQGAQIAAAQAATRDWQAIRADGDIQYAPLPPVKPPQAPAWLEMLGQWLQTIFGPAGQVLATVFFVLLAAVFLYICWRVLRPLLDARSAGKAMAEPEWAPERAAAVALLGDADRLAGEGRYGEAVHLLLQRSVGHIAETRPEWLLPASTAREIAAFPMLPERARHAFAAITARVERSLFALRELDAADWAAARAAYADFALSNLGSSNLGPANLGTADRKA